MAKRIRQFFETISNFFVRNRKVLIIGVTCLILIIVLAQIFWPKKYSLPFSKIGAEEVGIMDIDKIQQVIENQFSELEITVEADSDSKSNLKGISILDSGSLNKAWLSSEMEYPLAWRFVPFSFYFFKLVLEKLDNIYKSFVKNKHLNVSNFIKYHISLDKGVSDIVYLQKIVQL